MRNIFVYPMLLGTIETPFNSADYLSELKLDGIRLLLSKFNGVIKLYTRHGNEVTSKFPELLDLEMPDGTMLDGELICPDENGKPNFEWIMERFQSKKSQRFIQYCVFDMIYLQNERITSLALLERKNRLSEVLVPTTHVVLTQFMEGFAIEYFQLVEQQELEGIVMKKKDSKYEINKRSKNWLKVINYQYEWVNIIGLRKGEFGAILSYEDGEYAGVLEFMPPAERKKLYSMKEQTGENESNIYIKPIKMCVKFRNYTSSGLLRIPSFYQW